MPTGNKQQTSSSTHLSQTRLMASRPCSSLVPRSTPTPSVPKPHLSLRPEPRSQVLTHAAQDVAGADLEQTACQTSLSVYLGFDPTADSLHLGHLLGIVVLKWFQKCGHEPVALLGGATGRIGDPSGAEKQLYKKHWELNAGEKIRGLHGPACLVAWNEPHAGLLGSFSARAHPLQLCMHCSCLKVSLTGTFSVGLPLKLRMYFLCTVLHTCSKPRTLSRVGSSGVLAGLCGWWTPATSCALVLN